MDEQRLDALSRLLARGPSRRAVLGGLGVLLAGRTLARTTPPVQAAAEEGWVVNAEGIGLCRLPGFPCGNDDVCCSGCRPDGTCGCRRRGKRAWRAALCCSGKKKRGRKGQCR